MNFKTPDWYGLFAYLSSGGGAVLFAAFGQYWPDQVKTIALISVVVVFFSGLLVRFFSNKTGAPATAITQDAVIVPPGTLVVHASTPQVAAGTPGVLGDESHA